MFLAYSASAQAEDSIETHVLPILKTTYAQVEVTGQRLLAVAEDRRLLHFDLETKQRLPLKAPKDTVSHITKDHNGRIYALTYSNDVYLLVDTVFVLVVNSSRFTYQRREFRRLHVIGHDSIIAEGYQGLFVFADRKWYYPEKHFEARKQLNNYYGFVYSISNCSSVGIGKNGPILYLGYNFGEWGGGYVGFDLNARRFLSQPRGEESAQSLTKSKDGEVFGFASLSHMWTKSWYITRVSRGGKILARDNAIYCYEWLRHPEQERLSQRRDDESSQLGFYWGPGSFKPGTDSLLLYTEKGFNYGLFTADTMNNYDFKDFKVLFRPRVLWPGGQSDAVGVGLSVTKVHWIERRNQFVFLTSLSGIGYFDGKRLYMIQ
jgi:hypothetical protein